MESIRQIRKRDGRLVPFERGKIADAVFRAAQAVGGEDRYLAEQLAGVVEARVAKRIRGVPTIEDVQDAVEKVLIEAGHARTAKTYILYRERRHELRAARVRAAPDRAVRPLVGGDPRPHGALSAIEAPGAASGATALAPGADLLTRLSKAQLVDGLMVGGSLALGEAQDVARAVEERILRSGRTRLSQSTLDTLVGAELFDRGHSPRRALAHRRGVPVEEVERLLRSGPQARRAPDPATLSQVVGETLFARHLLDQSLPRGVAEAHRVGDVHLYDLGAPHRLTAVALDAVAVGEPLLKGHQFTRRAAARRAMAAIEEALLCYAPLVGRVLTLERVNVFLAPFFDHLDDQQLSEHVRELLLAPALRRLDDRGGLLRVELGLVADMPLDHLRREVPAPGLPGRTYGDYSDAAMRVLRAFVAEVGTLRRAGQLVRPALTVILDRQGQPDAAIRALLREAVRAAIDGGEPQLRLDEPGHPSRGGRWLRRTEAEARDPLRFPEGDLSIASAGAINMVAAALRARDEGEAGLLREVERLIALILEAAGVRHELLDAGGQDPDGVLYALRRGTHPLVDLEGAFHAVEMIGLDPAVALLARLAPERVALRERVLRHATRFLARQGAARRLETVLVEEREAEAAVRFARVDAERYPEVAAWWGEDTSPSYRRAVVGGNGIGREPLLPADGLPGGARCRLRRRVAAHARPTVEDLLGDVLAALADPTVAEVAIDPWPRRTVRRGDGDPALGARSPERQS